MTKRLSVALSLLLLMASTGCATYVRVQVVDPPEVFLPKVQSIAMGTFEAADPMIGGTLADLITAELASNSDYYKIVERTQLAMLLQEQELAMTGMVDSGTAAQFGRLAGVDAMIFGRVLGYGYEDFEVVEKKSECEGGHCVDVPVTCIVRRTNVNVLAKVVRTETGEIIASINRAVAPEAKTCEGALPPPAPTLLQNALRDMARLLAKLITPQYRTEKRRLLSSDTEEAKMDQAIEFAKQNRWDRAMQLWGEVVQAVPTCHEAHYNLGVALEVSGDLYGALDSYKKAEAILPEKLYMQAVQKTNKRIADEALLKESGATS